jgi:hypothetical protein
MSRSGRIGLLCFGLESYGMVWQEWRVMASQGTVRFGRVRHGGLGWFRQVKAGYGLFGQAWYGSFGLGLVGHGRVWHGWLGVARLGAEWTG